MPISMASMAVVNHAEDVAGSTSSSFAIVTVPPPRSADVVSELVVLLLIRRAESVVFESASRQRTKPSTALMVPDTPADAALSQSNKATSSPASDRLRT